MLLDPFLHSIKECRDIVCAKELLFSQIEPSQKIDEALKFALEAHSGQFRKSGEPYIVHPILVAAITAFISGNETMVQAALLHDTVEDTEATVEEIEMRFGNDVAHLVEGLTKIVALRDNALLPSSSDQKLLTSALTFRKMLLASVEDIRVLVIKLCDRVHNLLTIESLPSKKQKRIAEESLVVYAPIAHRLGIAQLKNVIEDFSFAIIYPEQFEEIDRYLKEHTHSLQLKLNYFISEVKALLQKGEFSKDAFEIQGRIKHNYSIFLKMQRKGVGIDEVLDLLAIRIITKGVLDCYKALGILHTNFTPLIARFKDYIGVPKGNGYQTIHTTLFTKEGIFESQIRTLTMHRLAEYGIAAHWKYKEGERLVDTSWIKNLHYSNDSIEEFYELAKNDLYSEDVTVFSPKGDFYTLPKGSTALDFAFAVHSEVGHSAIGAMINKKRVPLLATLKNGDVVQIIRGKERVLHCSWVDALKTSKAKAAIKTACKLHKKMLDHKIACNILKTLLNDVEDRCVKIVDVLDLQASLYRIVTNGNYLKEMIKQIVDYLAKQKSGMWERFKMARKRLKEKKIGRLRFLITTSVTQVEFDYCCHTKTGDEIVAFYKDGKAIIHHKLCKGAQALIESGEPMLFVEWSMEKLVRYRLLIALQNQKGVLANLLKRLSRLELNVTHIELGISNSQEAQLCRIEVESPIYKKAQLEQKIASSFKLIEIVSLDDAYNQ